MNKMEELECYLTQARILNDLVECNVMALGHCLDLALDKIEELKLDALSETSIQLDKLIQEAFVKEYSEGGFIRKVIREEDREKGEG